MKLSNDMKWRLFLITPVIIVCFTVFFFAVPSDQRTLWYSSTCWLSCLVCILGILIFRGQKYEASKEQYGKLKMDQVEIRDVCITTDYKEGDIDLQWVANGIGTGHLAFYEKDGKIYCNNETMGRDFIKAVLNKLVDVSVMNE